MNGSITQLPKNFLTKSCTFSSNSWSFGLILLTHQGENHRPFNNTSHSESGVIFQPINFLLFQQAFCRSFRLQGIHPHTKNKQMFPVPPKKGLSQWEKKKHVLKPLIFKGHVFFLFSELYFVVCPVLLPRVFSIKRSRNSETFQKGCQTKTSLNI